jgi:hypothetical protein
MPNLNDQLRRYGGYLDTLESPAARPREDATRAPRWSPALWSWARRPQFAFVLASAVALVVTVGLVIAVANGGGSGNVQATRTAAGSKASGSRAPESKNATAADGAAAPSATTPDGRSVIAASGPAVAPDAATRSAVEQQLRTAFGPCPTVGQATSRARLVTTTTFGTAYAVRVDPGSSGPCAALARVDWDRQTVHLERSRSTP